MLKHLILLTAISISGCSATDSIFNPVDETLLAKQKKEARDRIEKMDASVKRLNNLLSELRAELKQSDPKDIKQHAYLVHRNELAEQYLNPDEILKYVYKRKNQAEAGIDKANKNEQMGKVLYQLNEIQRFYDGLPKNNDGINAYFPELIKTANAYVKWQTFKDTYHIDNRVRVAEDALEEEEQAEYDVTKGGFDDAIEHLKKAQQLYTAALTCCEEQITKLKDKWQQQDFINSYDKAATAKAKKDLKKLMGTFVDIPSGNFIMGALGGSYNMRPLRRVLVRSFKMQEHELTWDQFMPCVESKVCEMPDERKNFGHGDRPVMYVNREHVITYIRWLNRQGIGHYRLPTEAEWEYAARAGTTTRFSWGDTIDCSKASYGYYARQCGDEETTDPVKSFPPNQWGLYDMIGNAWEWTEDCWQDYYDNTPRYSRAYLGSSRCHERSIRGGAWYSDSDELSVPERGGSSIHSEFDLGFRLVLETGSTY